MTKHLLQFVIYALATYRLTVLAVFDDITAKLRHAIIAWAVRHRHNAIKTFVSCAWCVSIWTGGGVTVLARYGGSWAIYPCAALALSAVAGFLADRH